MNKIALFSTLGLLALASQAQAQVKLIAGWDFDVTNTAASHMDTGINDWDIGSVFDMGSINSPTVFSDASPEIVGTVFWNGLHGSTAYNYLGYDGDIIGTPGTPSINQISGSIRPVGPFFGTEDSTSAANALGFYGSNGSFVVAVPTTGFEQIQLSYAARQSETGADAADTITWAYSLNGIAYTPTGVTHNMAVGTYAARTLDLSAIALVSNQSMVYLRGTLAGATGVQGFDSVLAIDNIQVTGIEVIPEPSTYAALAGLASLGFLMHRRRNRR